MASWTTIQDDPESIDEAISSFGDGVTSIDDFSVTSFGKDRVVAVIKYTS